MPTLGLLRQRFHHIAGLDCAKQLDLQSLIDFQGLVVHESNQAAQKAVADYQYLRKQVTRLMQEQHVATLDALDQSVFDDARQGSRQALSRRSAAEYSRGRSDPEAPLVRGLLHQGNGRYTHGALDWATRDALAEFERRHRVYSWGYLGRDTLEVLRMTPVEAERRSVVRVLGERAIHAAGVLEDGSTSTLSDGVAAHVQRRRRKGASDPEPRADALEQRVIEAFGLQTPESTLAVARRSLGKLPAGEHRFVAVRGPAVARVLRRRHGLSRSTTTAATSGTTFRTTTRAASARSR